MTQYTEYAAPAVRPPQPRPHLPALDGLRFVAAMHIVLFHTLHVAWLRPVTWGSTSTSLFFILSGFVLAYAYTADDGRLRVPKRELWWRRFARLYPLAVLTQLAAIPLAWNGYAPGERGLRAAAVLTGIQGWFPSIADSFNSPGWSVSVLAFCYLVFPALASALRGCSPRRLAAVLVVVWLWSLVPTAAYLLMDGGESWFTVIHHHPLSRLPEFAFGVVLARLFVTLPTARVPRWTAAVAVAALAAALLLLPDAAYPLAHNGLLAPLHALLIVALAAGGGVLARVLAVRPLRALGHASYALFLLHVPLYAWVMMPLAPTVTRMPLAARAGVYVGYLVLTAVCAWAVQRWVADPARAIHRARAASRAPEPPVASPTPTPTLPL
jgi:peptidoglycan/LPS O-acetylase OafA/YrhL